MHKMLALSEKVKVFGLEKKKYSDVDKIYKENESSVCHMTFLFLLIKAYYY